MAKYLIGTDNGGTLSKAALFTPDAQEIAAASRKADMLMPAPGHCEFDMDAVWKATSGAIRTVLAESGVKPSDVACVAPTGHGNGLYMVDEDGRPVRNAIVSTDSRARDYVARWYAAGTARAVLPKTMQSLWAGQPMALLAWLKDNEPEVLKRARWVLMAKDYVRYRLTGRAFGELTDMSGTNLISVPGGDYDDELLKAFGIADLRDKLPPIRRSDDICGHVVAQAAADTGLAEGTPVAGGVFDVDASAIASGIVDETQMCIIAGTWGISEYVSPTPVVSEDLFMTSRYCIPPLYLILEASPTSASNLEWFVREFLKGETAQAKEQGKSVYEHCNDLASGIKPEDADIVFLPFLFGSNVGADAKACFIGLNNWHSRGHVVRAIYEGVVFGHMTHVDKLMRYRGRPRTVRLAGGAARSEVWTQIFADVLQVPVEVTTGSELGALGAAICAAVASGCHPGWHQAVQAMVKVARVQNPDPSKKDVYARKYRNYLDAVKLLGPFWKQLAS